MCLCAVQYSDKMTNLSCIRQYSVDVFSAAQRLRDMEGLVADEGGDRSPE
jgi:hypothetical protein